MRVSIGVWVILMSVLTQFKKGYYYPDWHDVDHIKHQNEWVSGVRRVKVPYQRVIWVSKTFWSLTSSKDLPMSEKKKRVFEEEEWIYSQLLKREFKDGSIRFTYLITDKLPQIPWKGTFNQWRPGQETIVNPEHCEALHFRLCRLDDRSGLFKYKSAEDAYADCLAHEEAWRLAILNRYSNQDDDGQRF